jgi:hypothetical protein
VPSRAPKIASGEQFFIVINNDTTFAPDFRARLVAASGELAGGAPARVIRSVAMPGGLVAPLVPIRRLKA